MQFAAGFVAGESLDADGVQAVEDALFDVRIFAFEALDERLDFLAFAAATAVVADRMILYNQSMSRLFRKEIHKITLLLTAVFWANCGAAEKTQDTSAVLDSSKLETSDSTKKILDVSAWLEVSDWLDGLVCYYGVNYESGEWDLLDGLEYIARDLTTILDDKQKLKR